ncbi:MAG: NUDIX hydrolase [Actinomycetota bacterium]|nr:NUDIX hydrolase [Actinomycetota bacterium]
MSRHDDDVVRAAGGVIWRRNGAGGLEVVLAHRPSYDDWSLPKGKAEPGETDEQTALREVEEEVGVVGRIGPELPSTRYRDRHGRPKVVRYWAMTPESGRVGANHEIDDAGWFPIEAARRKLSYDRDRDVIDALAAAIE